MMFFAFLQHPYIFCNILILTSTVQGDIMGWWNETMGNCDLWGLFRLPAKSKFEKEDKNGYTSKKRPSNADSVCDSAEL
jgi:hypothetical protein